VIERQPHFAGRAQRWSPNRYLAGVGGAPMPAEAPTMLARPRMSASPACSMTPGCAQWLPYPFFGWRAAGVGWWAVRAAVQ